MWRFDGLIVECVRVSLHPALLYSLRTDLGGPENNLSRCLVYNDIEEDTGILQYRGDGGL